MALLRGSAQRFCGKVGTYDPAITGAGYLFAAQDARLSCCSSDMIDDLRFGDLLVSYYLLGSYFIAQVMQVYQVIELEDFTLTLSRTAPVPKQAANVEGGFDLLRLLLSPQGENLVAKGAGTPAVEAAAFDRKPHLRPIRLDPGLLAKLDRVTRATFLEEWRAEMEQP